MNKLGIEIELDAIDRFHINKIKLSPIPAVVEKNFWQMMECYAPARHRLFERWLEEAEAKHAEELSNLIETTRLMLRDKRLSTLQELEEWVEEELLEYPVTSGERHEIRRLQDKLHQMREAK